MAALAKRYRRPIYESDARRSLYVDVADRPRSWFSFSRWNRYLLENHYDTYHRNDTWKYVKALLQLAGKDEVRDVGEAS